MFRHSLPNFVYISL